VTLVLFVCVYVYHAARVNDQYKAHVLEVHGHSLKVGLDRSSSAEKSQVLRLKLDALALEQGRGGKLEEKKAELHRAVEAAERRDKELKRTLDALAACSESVRTMDEMLFFDFLGIRADDALLNLICTFGITFVSTFVGIYKSAMREHASL
jgi:hypothetical protein